MKTYKLGNETGGYQVFVATPSEAGHILKEENILHTESHDLSRISLSKAELHHEFWECSLCIPNLSHPQEKKRLQFYIKPGFLLFLDDNNYMDSVVEKLIENMTDKRNTLERFLYDFFRIILEQDSIHLDELEAAIMEIEDNVLSDKAADFQKTHTALRKNLLILHAYYEGLSEMATEFETNDNAFFDDNNLNYFDIIKDRADRLMNKTDRLLEYLAEIRETNLEMINDKQNRNMNYLTIISTIFLPLTLITGWFGMNFVDMPGLEHGFYFMVFGCVAIVILIVLILKKKKFL